MPSNNLTAVAALLAMGIATLPASAQTPAPEITQPEATAPEVVGPGSADPGATAQGPSAPGSDAGPSHRLTAAAVVFNLVDRDGDGEIDFDEANTLFEAVFTTLDADDDRKLSKDEINAALRRMHVRDDEGHGYDWHHWDRRHQ
jgi:hypothetical protein